MNLLGGFQTKNPEEEPPPWRTTPKIDRFWEFEGGFIKLGGYRGPEVLVSKISPATGVRACTIRTYVDDENVIMSSVGSP